MTIGDGGVVDRERLAAISAAADDATLEVLRPLLRGRPGGGAVLDVGCGNGSVAVRLAGEAGVGAVYALDQDLSLLPDVLPGGVRPVAADVRWWEPEVPLDLVHARFLLSHLAERDEVLRRMVSWLAPGGHVVITEPYQLDAGADPRVRDVLAAYRRAVEDGGMSLDFARRVPGLLTAFGLVDVTVTARPSRLGGGAGVDRWAALVDRVELPVPAGALAAFHEFAAAPDTFEIPQLILTTVGQAKTQAASFRS